VSGGLSLRGECRRPHLALVFVSSWCAHQISFRFKFSYVRSHFRSNHVFWTMSFSFCEYWITWFSFIVSLSRAVDHCSFFVGDCAWVVARTNSVIYFHLYTVVCRHRQLSNHRVGVVAWVKSAISTQSQVSIGRPYLFHLCLKADGPSRRRHIIIIL
jgi:hypothetical protein